MAQSVRVVSLQASNVLRLSAVEFVWEDGVRVLTLGGKNGAGKSSVINAVAMALGGMSLCPAEPLKRGEQRGFVELNLGELIVRREFWRDVLTEQPENGPTAYGETKSRLIVKNTEGVKQEPAQRLLDKLIGKLSFDPTAFALDDEKTQAETLRKIVGLDFKDHDEQRAIAYERRAVFNKEYKSQLVLLDAMPKYDDVPAEEVSLADLSAQLTAADALRKKASEAERWLSTATSSHREALADISNAERLMREAQTQLELAQKKVEDALANKVAKEGVARVAAQGVDKATEAAKAASDAVPDTSAINAKIADAEDINSKIRANVARKQVMDRVVKQQHAAEEQDALITSLDEQRAKKIRDTKFPIDGLAISRDGAVTFNNIALKQASTAEQIRVSVAIGFALNPALKLLCVRNGNALDDDSFKLIAEQAERAGGQVLMEVVTKDAGDVSVFIEDGHS